MLCRNELQPLNPDIYEIQIEPLPHNSGYEVISQKSMDHAVWEAKKLMFKHFQDMQNKE